MKVTQRVRKILSWYESDNPGTKTNLARILMTGKLAGTGKMVILPVDQGWEHGPARSFAPNPVAYDPHYFPQLAVDTTKDQAITSSVGDALRLGCTAVGFTIYPGSDQQFEMIEEIREITEEAKSVGLAVVLWSYPRGGDLTKDGETAIDVTAYAAHMAAQMGANIIKVKPPTDFIESPDAQKVYDAQKIDIATLSARISHIMESSFGGRRLVVFSGGAAKGEDAIYDEIRGLRDGGANGSIIGRNSFQRSREDALNLLGNIIKIYQGKF